MLIRKALKKYPWYQQEGWFTKGVCIWDTQVCVYGCAWMWSYNMCACGIRVWVCKKRHMVWGNSRREKEQKKWSQVNMCEWVRERVRLRMRDREMKAWEEIVRSWHRRWQLSAAAFRRPGIPHTPATLYMPTYVLIGSYCLHYSDHCNSRVVCYFLIFHLAFRWTSLFWKWIQFQTNKWN